jgi:hypothetical protein
LKLLQAVYIEEQQLFVDIISRKEDGDGWDTETRPLSENNTQK